MRRWRYEDAERPWEADDMLKKHVTRAPWLVTRGGKARALDLGMGYGRNAVWLAEQGFEVEGWEVEGRYVREASKEWRRRREEKQVLLSASLVHARDLRPEGSGLRQDDRGNANARLGRLRVRRGDFGGLQWAERGQQYDVIVISQALHQLKRSAALRVLRRAKKALNHDGSLFLLAKLTRDRHVRRAAASPEWQRVPGEKNTWRRAAPRRRREFHAGRPRRRWRLLSALTPGEIRGALRGLRLVQYREVVLRSDWCAQGASASGGEEMETVTHTVAEVVGVKM